MAGVQPHMLIKWICALVEGRGSIDLKVSAIGVDAGIYAVMSKA